MIPRILTDLSTNPVLPGEWMQTVPTQNAHQSLEFWRNKTLLVDPRQNPFRARGQFSSVAFAATRLENQSQPEPGQATISLTGIRIEDSGDT